MTINTTIEVTHTDEVTLISTLNNIIKSILSGEIEDMERMDGTYAVGDADITIDIEENDASTYLN